MKPLRAYLFAKSQEGVWSCTAFRELEPLLEAARSVLANGSTAATIHVGFWRPETEAVGKFSEEWENLILLSESAASALPPQFSASALPVGDVGGLNFYMSLAGFGYEMDDPSDVSGVRKTNIARPQKSKHGSPAPVGWVAQLMAAKPDVEPMLTSAEIVDDESYHQKEASLDAPDRLSLALDRYAIITGGRPSPDTILDNLHACPHWFLDGRLEQLSLTARMVNVCHANDLKLIGDLATKGTNGLLKLSNMGRKSTRGLAALLCDAFMRGDMLHVMDWRVAAETGDDDDGGADIPGEGPLQVAQEDNLAPPDSTTQVALPPTFVAGVVDAAEVLTSGQRDIWQARLGFRQDFQTLQQLADKIGLTRERVRQIEKTAFKRICNHPVWGCLDKRLTAALEGRTSPLMIAGLSAIDPWFEGADGMVTPLREIFAELMAKKFSVINFDDGAAVSRISISEWDETIQIGKTLMRALVREKTSEEYARYQVQALLGDRGAELREDLWREVSAQALWAQATAGEQRLFGFGRTAEALVTAVLEESGKPLHVKEIHRRACELAHEPHDLIRIHHAAQGVAYLYGRGTYGLLSHCPLNKDELAAVEAEIEDLVAEGDPTRQWHASEFLEELLERGMGFDGRLTKHIINIALFNNSKFAYMRRMVWGLKDAWVESAASRLDVRQAVISVLEAAGGPLTKEELTSRLAEGRGVGNHFQIHPAGNLVRIGQKHWGLADRDVQIQNPDDLIEAISKRIEETQQGVHISEAKELLPDIGEGDARTLWSIAKSKGMQVDRGQYLFPGSWADSRRMSPSEAIRDALQSLPPGGASLESICEAVNRLTGRAVPRPLVRHMLASSDEVLFDDSTGRWAMGVAESEADEDTEPETQ